MVWVLYNYFVLSFMVILWTFYGRCKKLLATCDTTKELIDVYAFSQVRKYLILLLFY